MYPARPPDPPRLAVYLTAAPSRCVKNILNVDLPDSLSICFVSALVAIKPAPPFAMQAAQLIGIEFELRKPALCPTRGCIIDTVRGITGADEECAAVSLDSVYNRTCYLRHSRNNQFYALRPRSDEVRDFPPVKIDDVWYEPQQYLECADASTLVEILLLLPGERAQKYRREFVAFICDQLCADLSLVVHSASSILSDEDKQILLSDTNAELAEQLKADSETRNLQKKRKLDEDAARYVNDRIEALETFVKEEDEWAKSGTVDDIESRVGYLEAEMRRVVERLDHHNF